MSSLAPLIVALTSWAVLPGMVALAQVTPLEPDDPSPATRHAQVIAHGVAVMPAAEIGWRVTVPRALPPSRAAAEEGLAGFVLADNGAVALVDENGNLLARIAPGEAVWNEPGVARAVVALDRKTADYFEIAVVPAIELAVDRPDPRPSASFVAPTGEAFDVDLIRDVLNRGEENVVSTGPSPAILLVTSGTVFVGSIGGLSEVTAGNAVQIASDVVITGASRAPAAFVVARIGPEVPARVALEDPAHTVSPASVATPVGRVEGGLTEAWETPVGDYPWLIDSDADGLSDGDEIDFYGTDPLAPDTDGDGLDDGEELLIYGTNPLLADTDGDGVGDGEEVAAGFDPLDATSLPPPPTPTATPAPTREPALAATPALLATPLPVLDIGIGF